MPGQRMSVSPAPGARLVPLSVYPTQIKVTILFVEVYWFSLATDIYFTRPTKVRTKIEKQSELDVLDNFSLIFNPLKQLLY